MLVGLTYDLRSDYLKEGYSEEETAEFDRESTIEAIDKTLQSLGYSTDRIGHVKELALRLSKGNRWDIIFNICEGIYGIGREAQVPALLDAFRIPYTFSDPLVLALTLHKGTTKRVIRDGGIPTPGFAIVESEEDIKKVHLPFPLFVKPVAEGTGKGIDAKSRVTNAEELGNVCMQLLPRFSLGLIIETYLPGREFTVGIVGTGKQARSIGVLEVTLKEGAEANSYTYVNKENCEQFVVYHLVDGELAKSCKQVSLDAWRLLNCRDAGRVDIRLDNKGVPHFLEVNPLAGLHPEHSDLPIICNLAGYPYRELIRSIMDSALLRSGLSKPL